MGWRWFLPVQNYRPSSLLICRNFPNWNWKRWRSQSLLLVFQTHWLKCSFSALDKWRTRIIKYVWTFYWKRSIKSKKEWYRYRWLLALFSRRFLGWLLSSSFLGLTSRYWLFLWKQLYTWCNKWIKRIWKILEFVLLRISRIGKK